ncbi:MAG: hypothetical protein QOE45_2626 [Frankiaceae bacterium]|jgi:hypothetical protein|nr:hypothetical protein [Frankiaceae bacterium]
MKRTLTLKRETLAELTAGDLTLVNGAQVPSVFCTSALTFCDLVCRATGATQADGNITTLVESLLCPTTR